MFAPPDQAGDEPRCSAKGCRNAATVDLSWRNPRLHDASRDKHWLACDEHADSLADFLSRRNFLLGRDPLG
ncbi:acetone carboxylase [uncultured Jatrophihabitans sp.]|uniref:acetone carboxylase n=1 Tax=uncultured Jatrophihabitans sp. TaxID=1610747 RepID=UPI0035C951E0